MHLPLDVIVEDAPFVVISDDFLSRLMLLEHLTTSDVVSEGTFSRFSNGSETSSVDTLGVKTRTEVDT